MDEYLLLSFLGIAVVLLVGLKRVKCRLINTRTATKDLEKGQFNGAYERMVKEQHKYPKGV